MHTRFPAWRYHRTEAPRIVQSPEQEAALGPGWADTPAAFLDPAPVCDAPADPPARGLTVGDVVDNWPGIDGPAVVTSDVSGVPVDVPVDVPTIPVDHAGPAAPPKRKATPRASR